MLVVVVDLKLTWWWEVAGGGAGEAGTTATSRTLTAVGQIINKCCKQSTMVNYEQIEQSTAVGRITNK